MQRLGTPSDLEPVFAIYMDATVVPFLGFDPMPLADFRPVFDALVASRCFHIHEVAGTVAGFYRATRHAGRARHCATLATLAVAPALQGRGVAHAMVNQAIDALRREGVTRIDLTVEADNPRGLAFYTRLGFEIEGRLRKCYQRAGEPQPVDDFIMAMVFD